MNVTHIIDKLREKYKDHEDYWTKEDIVESIHNKDDDFYFSYFDKHKVLKDWEKEDFFGISPYFLFVKNDYIWNDLFEYLKDTLHPSFLGQIKEEPLYKGEISDFPKKDLEFYEVYTLNPTWFRKKKLFSKDEIYQDFETINSDDGMRYYRPDNLGDYKLKKMFYSFLLEVNEKNEFIFPFINSLNYEKNKISLFKTNNNLKTFELEFTIPSNYNWIKHEYFKGYDNLNLKDKLRSQYRMDKLDSSFFWSDFLNECKSEFESQLTQKKESISQNKDELIEIVDDFLISYDSDKNDVIDLFEEDNGFSELLKKHQKKIIEIDRSYIQNFVKMNEYIKTKKSNCIQTFNLIKEQLDEYKELDVKSYEDYDEENYKENIEFFKSSFEDLIQTYRLLVLHSLSMITSLVNDDMITFYEIYEILDKLGIFNSNHENLIEDKLSNIETSLKELISSINQMESNIVKGLDKLTYVTESSFKDLNKSIVKELQGIDSKLGFNNLLTSINTYQTYKLRK